MPLAGKIVIALLSFGVAAYAVIGYGLLPLGALVHPEMKALFVRHPLGVYLHVFAAAVTLLLGPVLFSARLRQNRLYLHRWLGRIYLGVGVLLGGLAGLYIAQFAYGGMVARLGFAALAVSWLYSGVRAYLAIRRREIAAHQKWVIRNFALAFAAVMLRLYIPLSVVAGIDFAVAYPLIAWLCWLPNLLVAEWICNRSGNALL